MAGARVYADVGSKQLCKLCGGPLHVQKTTQRHGKTLTHGAFTVIETIYACPNCKGFVLRQESLGKLLIPQSTIGYDVMTFVGTERFTRYRQRKEIQADLRRDHGIVLSTGEISYLARSFLIYLKALHESKAGPLRALLDADGGYPLHIDATSETGRGTIFVAYAGWREWVLGSWKIPTERADAMIPRLKHIESQFGAPCAIMRDLGRAGIDAAEQLVGNRDIPIFACHLHFLKDIGKDLLTPSHDKLRDLFRRHKIRARLAAHARVLGRSMGSEITQCHAQISQWLDGARHQPLPEGSHGGLAIARALTQWVLDFATDGTDVGFPFDRPWLDLYHRCNRALRVLESLLTHPSKDKTVNRALESLHSTLIPVRSQVPFQELARRLEIRADLFDQLRDVLRVGSKPTASTISQECKREEAQAVHADLLNFETSLRDRRPERGPAKDLREAIDTILKHFDRHGPHLSGHAILLPNGQTRLVDRTNVVIEQFFGQSKRGERRRSGRKNLAQDLEQMPAEAFLARNLEQANYLDIVCAGKIDNLPAAFAKLDEGNRSRSLPARITANASEGEVDIVSSSLPKADRNFLRTRGWNDRMLMEAKSRADLR
ncbi:MAG: hypothetical protein AAB403_11915, partial [Planctomycetota bacterium]